MDVQVGADQFIGLPKLHVYYIADISELSKFGADAVTNCQW